MFESDIGGGSLAHRFYRLIAYAIVTDAGSITVAVAVGSSRCEQVVALGEVAIKIDLRRSMGGVEDLYAVESIGN